MQNCLNALAKEFSAFEESLNSNKQNTEIKNDYLRFFLDYYYPIHFFALYRAHEMYNIEPFINVLAHPILDLGCGDGVIAQQLFKEKLEYGIDLDLCALDKAKKVKAYSHTIFASAHSIPLQGNSLGGIFSNCVLEHIPDMESVIKEISRTLKPQAYFVGTCLGPEYYSLNPAFTMLGRPLLKHLKYMMINQENKLHNHVSVFRMEQYKKMFEDNGMALRFHKYYAPEPIFKLCSLMDTLSKYDILSNKLVHNGLLIKYLKLRYKILNNNKEANIEKWYQKYKDICYDSNSSNRVGVSQILVAQKL
jgi:SAM-dependent methyltransferase